jgi:hypothetical protein
VKVLMMLFCLHDPCETEDSPENAILKKKKKNPYYHPTFCVIGSKEFYAREQDLG